MPLKKSRRSKEESAKNRCLLEAAPAFQKALHDWYDKNHRKLPWRERPSLYRTVVSEFMCQQTRIRTVLPYFERWVKALPDFKRLAEAPEEQVLKLWEGLGYYRRARNLHKLAKEIAALDEPPRSAKEWLEFPGIGPYSAAAITSIAFDTPAACVDGNVVRVLARLTNTDTLFKNTGSANRHFQPLAQELLDRAAPGKHNQAMMELGATHCQPKPECGDCPVESFCEARKHDSAENIPQFLPRQTEKLEITRIWRMRGNKILLSRAAKNSRQLAGLCELPTAESVGLPPEKIRTAGILKLRGKRSITRFSITEWIYEVPEKKLCTKDRSLFWADRDEISSLTFSGPHRRWISKLLNGEKAPFEAEN